MLYRLLRPARPDRFFAKNPKGYADSDPASRKRIGKQMKRAWLLFGVPCWDFWICRCDRMDWRQWRDIVPYRRQEDLWQKVNDPAAKALLNDKWEAYLHFRPFYRREMVFVPGDAADLSEFRAFIGRHPRFVVKPCASNKGTGVHLFDAATQADPAGYLTAQHPEGFVAEELIVQDPVMAQLHPASVNTLRIPTYYGPDGVKVLWPCLRMGQGGNFVDNTHAGGVFGAIDLATGRVFAACDESRHLYETHPDTGLPIVGFQMPRWEEACTMARELARLIPQCRVVAWDLALTADGWVMVEGNRLPLVIWQIASGKGIWPEFEPIEKQNA